jgi:hypothetical protein
VEIFPSVRERDEKLRKLLLLKCEVMDEGRTSNYDFL